MVNQLPSGHEGNETDKESTESQGDVVIKNTAPTSPAPNAPNKYKQAAKRYFNVAYQWTHSAWARTKPIRRVACRSSFWTALATIAIAVTAFYQWSAIRGQLSEMKRTNQIVQGQNRPWVAISQPAIMGKSCITLHVTNYGTAVARMVIGKAYFLAAEQAPNHWKQAESQREFDNGLKLNICEDAALESTDYQAHVGHGIVFPTQNIPMPAVQIDTRFLNRGQAHYIAVCVIYQGIGAAHELTANEIKKMSIEQWLHERYLFHSQSLYEIGPNGQLTQREADAYDQGQ